MKSIIFLGPAHPYRGGIASFNEILARTFQRQKMTVKMFNFSIQYPSFLFPGKTQYTDSPAPNDLQIIRLVSSVNPFNWLRTGYRIYKERPDAVVVRYWLSFMAPCLGTICGIARLNGHTKILALTDNVVPHEKHFFDAFLTRYFIASAHGFIYMSDQVRCDLEQFTTTKPALFSPHPIYDNYGERVSKAEACAELSIESTTGYLLFFGFVRDYKGLDLLLEAFALLKKSGKTASKKVIVAGEYYSDKQKYTDLIARLEMTDEVILMDYFIPDSQVKYLFSAADLVVQPYKSATQSGVTQIAYSFDVPMVVTAVGGLAEIVPDGKVGYVTDTTPEAIAEAIDKFYSENRKAEFTQNILEEKKRFSWNGLANKFEELYKLVKK